MFRRVLQVCACGIAVLIGLSGPSDNRGTAGDLLSGVATHCADCNCKCRCQKVCRLVREEAKVPITCWGCECEDICLPGPSHPGCRHCEQVCTECDPKVASASKPFTWREWIPGCPDMIVTKKKLMKKTVTKTVPSFKWVPVELCPSCVDKYTAPEVPKGTKLPPPPKDSGKVLGAAQ